MELPLDILNQPVLPDMIGLRSIGQKLAYFGKLRPPVKQKQDEITEVGVKSLLTSVNDNKNLDRCQGSEV
jgi:hypothetical protein